MAAEIHGDPAESTGSLQASRLTGHCTPRLSEIMRDSQALERLQLLTAGSAAFGLQVVSSSTVEAGRLRGGNALGLDPVSQTWLHMDVGWWWPGDDEKALDAARFVVGEVEDAAKATGNYLPCLFMNDANIQQDVIGSYGDANVKRLKEVQDRYDPDRVLQKLVPGGFKLGI